MTGQPLILWKWKHHLLRVSLGFRIYLARRLFQPTQQLKSIPNKITFLEKSGTEAKSSIVFKNPFASEISPDGLSLECDPIFKVEWTFKSIESILLEIINCDSFSFFWRKLSSNPKLTIVRQSFIRTKAHSEYGFSSSNLYTNF